MVVYVFNEITGKGYRQLRTDSKSIVVLFNVI